MMQAKYTIAPKTILIIFYLLISISISSCSHPANETDNLEIPDEYTQYCITFPENEAEKTEYSEFIFEVDPFTVQFIIPSAWSLGEYIATDDDYLYNGLWSRLSIFDESGTLIGAIGYNIYDSNTDLKNLMDIYNQIALGNNYRFDVKNTYTSINTSETAEIATVDVYHSSNQSGSDGTHINYGILANEFTKKVYVAFELNSNIVNSDQVSAIANSLIFSESK